MCCWLQSRKKFFKRQLETIWNKPMQLDFKSFGILKWVFVSFTTANAVSKVFSVNKKINWKEKQFANRTMTGCAKYCQKYLLPIRCNIVFRRTNWEIFLRHSIGCCRCYIVYFRQYLIWHETHIEMQCLLMNYSINIIKVPQIYIYEKQTFVFQASL